MDDKLGKVLIYSGRLPFLEAVWPFDNVTNVDSSDKLENFYCRLSRDFKPVSWQGAYLWKVVHHANAYVVTDFLFLSTAVIQY